MISQHSNERAPCHKYMLMACEIEMRTRNITFHCDNDNCQYSSRVDVGEVKMNTSESLSLLMVHAPLLASSHVCP